MPAKPGTLPRWADVSGTIVEPPSGKKDVGWVGGEQPPAGWLNWLFNTIHLWASYLNAPNNITLGADVQDTEANAVAARLTVDAAASAVADWTCVLAAENARLWVHHTDGLALTVNATRTTDGTDKWAKITSSTEALIVQFKAGSFQVGNMPAAQNTAWTDAFVDGEGTTSGWGRMVHLNTDAEADTVSEADTAMVGVQISDTAAAERKLIFDLLSATSGVFPARIYFAKTNSQGETGAIEITLNAKWGNNANVWTADKTGKSSKLVIGSDVVRFYTRANTTAGGTFADDNTGWDDRRFDVSKGAASGVQYQLQNGVLFFVNTATTDANSANPASNASTMKANALYAKAIPKSWGLIKNVAGGVSVEDGLNIASVSRNTTSQRFTITFTTAMQSANYGVTFGTTLTSGGFPATVSIISKATSNFVVEVYRHNTAGAAVGVPACQIVDVDAEDVSFDFDIHARQDS